MRLTVIVSGVMHCRRIPDGAPDHIEVGYGKS